MATQTAILINGRRADTVSIHDRGFQYGDGLFETIAVNRGTPLLWDQHVARLQHGAQRLHIECPPADLLQSEATALCADAAPRAVLKIILTRGAGGRGYAAHGADSPTRVLYLSAWPDYPDEFARRGVSVCLCETRLSRHAGLAGIKHLNRLEHVLARAEWRTEYADGIMRDEQGNVIEGTTSNLFIVVNGMLLTPDLSNCGVEGVMRGAVLQAAERIGIKTRITNLTMDDVEVAQEIFLTNSLIGTWPVRQFDDREYAIGPVTRAIQQATREAHCFDR